MYNNQYRQGLTNYHPKCQYWGQGWDPNKTGAHFTAGFIAGTSFTHADSEARSIATFWRGYLIEAGIMGRYDAATGKVSNTEAMGCPADTSLLDAPAGSYCFCLQGNQGNQLEPDIYSEAYRKAPPYVWYGPGTFDYWEVSIWRGWIYVGVNNNTSQRTTFKKRGPLLACPSVAMPTPPGESVYHPTHRPRWTFPRFPGNYTAYHGPYAQNVGYSDGSVLYYESSKITPAGGYDPTRQ
jgi:hypothetical protein